jgi:hypothetical protein
MKRTANTILEFNGRVNGPLMDQLLRSLQFFLEETEMNILMRKRVFSVAMECFQNVYRYAPQLTHSHDGEQDDANYTLAHLYVGYDEKGYKVSSGNYIFCEQSHNLVDSLQEVNGASDEELKKRYNDVLKNGKFNLRGGAGLGLMDMRRKSNKPLKYSIEDEGEQCWFELTIHV